MSEIDTDRQTDKKRSRSAGSWILLAILAAIVCVYLALVVGRHTLGLFPDHAQGGEHPAVGQRLPSLKLQPLTGDSTAVTLEELSGQIVLLNFWGTWCPPCREEFPHMATLSQKLKDEPRFRLLAVSCGGGADNPNEIPGLKSETQKFFEREHSLLPTYADESAETRTGVAMTFGDDRFLYPTTILLDGEARIRGVWLGYDEGYSEQMERTVDELLHPAEK